MIIVKSLSMRYGSFVALDRVSFHARDKEVLGLLGPNGAGKTTAMRLITTYLYPYSGTALVNGIDVLKQPIEARRQMGYLPETAPLYPDMQVDEYLNFVGKGRGLNTQTLTKRFAWLKESCGIGGVWKHTISELSRGYRQRVGLAQALIHDPKVVILDEPTSGLDPLQIIGIRNLIKDLARDKTIIFSTHILHEVEAIANQVVIINEGKIVAEGTQKALEEQVRRAGETKPNLTLEDIFISLLTPKNRTDPAKGVLA